MAEGLMIKAQEASIDMTAGRTVQGTAMTAALRRQPVRRRLSEPPGDV